MPYASTCNTSGQTLGIALGYMFFILFESEEFCNKWLRFTDQKGGIITMKGKLSFQHRKPMHTRDNYVDSFTLYYTRENSRLSAELYKLCISEIRG